MTKKTALWKSIGREIKQTFGRFFSIFSLLALGVFIFIGLFVTGQNMRDTALDFVEGNKLADIIVQSTFGLAEKDVELLNEIAGVETLEYGFSTDKVTIDGQNVFRIFSLTENISTYHVVEGRLPEKSGEIVLDYDRANWNYQVGDRIKFATDEADDNEPLKISEFEVVGMVQSPEYITNMSRGQAQIGSGEVSAFAAVIANDFSMDVYTIARISLQDTVELRGYTTTYDDIVDSKIATIETTFTSRPKQRLAEIKAEIASEIADAEIKITDGWQELAENEQKLQDADAELSDGKNTYYSNKDVFETQIASEWEKINTAETELNSAAVTLDAGNTELAKNRALLETWQTEWEVNNTILQQAKTELQTAKTELLEQLELAMATLPSLEEQLTTAEQSLPLIEQRIIAVENIIAVGSTPQLEQELTELQVQYQTLLETQAILQTNIAQLNEGIIELTAGLEMITTNEETLTEQEELLIQGQEELIAGAAQLLIAEQELAAGWYEYNNGLTQLQAGKETLTTAEATGRQQLNDALIQIQAGETELTDGWKTFNTEKAKAEKELMDAEQELADAKIDIANLKEPSYFINSRSVTHGYDDYQSNTERLDSLAYIFPVFFFFIAALVTLTTMTRMVEEQRGQLGTLKALGYTNADILKKYIVYGSVAGILGTTVGTVLGSLILPQIIFNAYSSAFLLTDLHSTINPFYTMIAFFISFCCTTGAVTLAVGQTLREKSTYLMRPKVPKSGQKIILERMTFIWQRLSFNYKVTARNVFRYKQRMLMTIIGVAGCTALIIMGFGLRESMSTTLNVQLNELDNYDITVVYDDLRTADQRNTYQQAIRANTDITETTTILNRAVETTESGKAKTELILFTPKDTEKIANFLKIQNRKTQEIIKLPDNGVIITEKFAHVSNLKIGDNLELFDEDFGKYTVEIAGVNQWYMGDYIFFSPVYYEKIFNETPKYNMDLVNIKSDSEEITTQIAKEIMELDSVIAVIQTESSTGMIEETLNNLNLIVAILIFCAGLLAIVVLYNLTNINVSERIRELSTVKVLGFYNQEVTMYIYREAIILTILGILAGSVLGYYLQQYLIFTMAPRPVYFDPELGFINYLYAAIITIIISLGVMAIIHNKLRKVNMIEALKAVE
jgi:Chromosome segregation ATPases